MSSTAKINTLLLGDADLFRFEDMLEYTAKLDTQLNWVPRNRDDKFTPMLVSVVFSLYHHDKPLIVGEAYSSDWYEKLSGEIESYRKSLDPRVSEYLETFFEAALGFTQNVGALLGNVETIEHPES